MDVELEMNGYAVVCDDALGWGPQGQKIRFLIPIPENWDRQYTGTILARQRPLRGSPESFVLSVLRARRKRIQIRRAMLFERGLIIDRSERTWANVEKSLREARSAT